MPFSLHNIVDCNFDKSLTTSIYGSFSSFHERHETFLSAWAFFCLVSPFILESTLKIDDSCSKLLERRLVEKGQRKERSRNTDRIINTHSFSHVAIYDVEQLSLVSGNILCTMVTCSNGYCRNHVCSILSQIPLKYDCCLNEK